MLFDARSVISGTNACVNTWHVSTTAGLTLSEANSVLAPFKTFYDAFASQRATGSSVTIGARVLMADPLQWQKPVGSPGKPGYTPGKWLTEPVITPATPLTSTAGSGGLALPPQLASVVSWRTVVSGRSGRGRTYLGNLGANMQVGSQIQSSSVTTINNAAAALIAAVSALTPASGPVKLCIWSPTKGVIRDVLTGASDTTFDTMRSRVK
jgi:hypothetical protein